MKILIPTYTFNAAAQQITFPGYTSLSLASFLLITDTTVNIIIYNFADPTAGGVLNGNVLTLDYNTTALSNNDKLLIYYDDGTIPARDSTIQLLENQNDLLRRMVKLLEAGGTVDSNNRQRMTIDAVTPAAQMQVTASIPGSVTTTLASTTITSISMPASTPVASALTTQIGNSYPDSVNPYTLSSRAALLTTEYPISQEWRMADQAKNTFANAIRPNIK